MMKLYIIFMFINVRNYAFSLSLNFQASPQMGMPFEKFMQLTLTQKEQKLIFAFKKISTRAQWDRNIYKSLSNFFRVGEIYSDMLQIISELRYFVATLLNDEDMETKPACHNKDPSIFGIEFLASDFEILLMLSCTHWRTMNYEITRNVTNYSKRRINCIRCLNFLRRNIIRSSCLETTNKFQKLHNNLLFITHTHLLKL